MYKKKYETDIYFKRRTEVSYIRYFLATGEVEWNFEFFDVIRNRNDRSIVILQGTARTDAGIRSVSLSA